MIKLLLGLSVAALAAFALTPLSARADAAVSEPAPAAAEIPLGLSIGAQSLPPTAFETKAHLLLKSLVNDLSESKDIRVEMVSGTANVEYQVFFHPNDEAAVRGLSGVTQSAISTLFNELSISSQKDDARAAHRPFDIHSRKYILVRFVKMES